MSLRIGIIGCGGIAKSHAEAYSANNLDIVAVTDVCEASAQSMAEETGASVYADYAALIDEARPDIVSICTPPVAHEEAAVYALEHSVHVLCEKPMAFDIASAQRMAEAAKASPALLMPAFRHRFIPANVALKGLIASGKIGDAVSFTNVFGGPAFTMEGKWLTKRNIAGGGCLTDTSSHSVDLFRFMMGEIVEGKAVTHRHFATTDVEDAGILCVKSKNGVLGSIQSSFVMGQGLAYIDILCTGGRAYYDYCDPEKVKYRLTADEDWTVLPVASSLGFTEEIAHLVGAVEGKHPLAVTVGDGQRAVEVIQGACA